VPERLAVGRPQSQNVASRIAGERQSGRGREEGRPKNRIQSVGVTQVGERIWLVTFMTVTISGISTMRRAG
jgi:hypothetical protein